MFVYFGKRILPLFLCDTVCLLCTPRVSVISRHNYEAVSPYLTYKNTCIHIQKFQKSHGGRRGIGRIAFQVVGALARLWKNAFEYLSRARHMLSSEQWWILLRCFGAEEKVNLLFEGVSTRQNNWRRGISKKERVSVEPVRCWLNLLTPRLPIIYLRLMPHQFCMERMRCGQKPFLQCSHDAV